MTTHHALIIDDNESNVVVLEMLLKNEGVSYTSIISPGRLGDVLDQVERVDVVFLDLEIPPFDGYAIFQDLKRDSRLNATPIVAYTVHISEIDEVRQAGFDGFLGKPLQTQKFSTQIRRILGGEPVWDI